MPKITEMFAFVAEDKGPDDEGIMTMHTGDGWMPMVGADVSRVGDLKVIADRIAEKIGTSYKVLHFKLVGELPLSEG